MLEKLRLERTGVTNGRSNQIDGLRGAAIILVFLHHSGLHVPAWMEWGQMGVRLFFVLSGYLITLSLWRMAERCDGLGLGRAGEVGIFHLRRLARLMPAFLVALAFGALAGLEDVVAPFWWHVTFLSNVKMAMQGWFFGPTAHFWSLAMQEQFYLIWPLILFAVPRRWFPVAASGLILVGFGYRVWCMQAGVSDYWRWLMVPGSIDTFALGGFLAWMKAGPGLPAFPHHVGSRALLVVGVILLWVLNRGWLASAGAPWLASFGEVLEGVVGGVLVWVCAKGVGGLAGWAFSLSGLRFLGRISYGIFVYHLIVMFALEPLAAKFGIGPQMNVGGWIALSGMFTLGIAVASWYLLEQPVTEFAKKMIERLMQTGGLGGSSDSPDPDIEFAPESASRRPLMPEGGRATFLLFSKFARRTLKLWWVWILRSRLREEF